MQSSDFIGASGYIRVLEKKLLSTAALDRMADAAGVPEVLRMLSQQSDYNFSALARSGDYEKSLKDELARVYAMAYKLSPHPEVVDIPAAKYDFHNLKTALKAKHFKQRTEPPFIEASRIVPSLLEAAVNNPPPTESKSDIPLHLFRAIIAAEEAFSKDGNPQSIDIALDRLMFARMLELCGAVGSELITRHVQSAIDFYNVKTLLRAKAMQKGTAFLAGCLVPGGLCDLGFFASSYSKTPAAMVPAFYYKSFGDAAKKGFEGFEKTGNYAALERLLDNILVEQVKAAKYLTYGPEVLYAYLFSKENELRQIRILVTAKQNHIRPEALRERLRENYA